MKYFLPLLKPTHSKMKSFLILFFAFTLLSCNRNSVNSDVKLQPGVFAVTVVEVIQSSKYTYLKVLDNNDLKWLAVERMNVSEDVVLYYTNAYRMDQFKSPELGRIFDVVYFVDQISETPEGLTGIKDGGVPVKASVRKYDVDIEPVAGGITVENLFRNSESLEGKEIIMKGKVVHYNQGIMERNWVHIQDGTEFAGKYDLIATTNQQVKVGDIVTIKGKVELNVDYGAGYTYELIITGVNIIQE